MIFPHSIFHSIILLLSSDSLFRTISLRFHFWVSWCWVIATHYCHIEIVSGFGFGWVLHFHICSSMCWFRFVSVSPHSPAHHEVDWFQSTVYRFVLDVIDLWCSDDRRFSFSQLPQYLSSCTLLRIVLSSFPLLLSSAAPIESDSHSHRPSGNSEQAALRSSLRVRPFCRVCDSGTQFPHSMPILRSLMYELVFSNTLIQIIVYVW